MDNDKLSEPDLTLVRSMADLQTKIDACVRMFGLGSGERWDVDLDAGFIKFTQHDLVATAPVQVIGTFNAGDGTWLWGWDHPSVQPSLAHAAELCRDFGMRYDLGAFTQRKISCTHEDAWQFTAVASYLSGANGAYRGPSGTTYVFMTFGTVTLSKPPETGTLFEGK